MKEYIDEEEDWEFSELQANKVREEFQKLLRQFQAIEARDYFEADLGRELRLMLEQYRKRLVHHF
jgi:hypothetical protein